MEVAPFGEFTADLNRAFRAWRTAPLLVVASLFFWATAYVVPDELWWFTVPVTLVMLGWFGAERIWYLRIFRNRTLSGREAVGFVRAFFPRFLRLALLSSVAWIPFFAIAVSLSRSGYNPDDLFTDPRVMVAAAVTTVVLDISLTFATPYLAFSTDRVLEAVPAGVRFFHRHWPASAPYGLIPPLAVGALLYLLKPDLTSPPLLVASLATALLTLLFKGATAAFYVRRVDVGDDGAAQLA